MERIEMKMDNDTASVFVRQIEGVVKRLKQSIDRLGIKVGANDPYDHFLDSIIDEAIAQTAKDFNVTENTVTDKLTRQLDLNAENMRPMLINASAGGKELIDRVKMHQRHIDNDYDIEKRLSVSRL